MRHAWMAPCRSGGEGEGDGDGEGLGVGVFNALGEGEGGEDEREGEDEGKPSVRSSTCVHPCLRTRNLLKSMPALELHGLWP